MQTTKCPLPSVPAAFCILWVSFRSPGGQVCRHPFAFDRVINLHMLLRPLASERAFR